MATLAKCDMDVKNILRQFITQAMPLFLIICIVAGMLYYAGISSLAE